MVAAELPEGLATRVDDLCEVGHHLYARGWSMGTSGQYSLVAQSDPLELLITTSRSDKRRLAPRDFLHVDAQGKAISAGDLEPPCDLGLHLTIAQCRRVGCILHSRSVWATELSQLFFDAGAVRLEGYEMLKDLSGVDSHAYQFWLEIFDNKEDIAELTEALRERMTDDQRPLTHGFLIRRHGLYTWGRDICEARRHTEVLEFLLECQARRRMLARTTGVVEFPNMQ